MQVPDTNFVDYLIINLSILCDLPLFSSNSTIVPQRKQSPSAALNLTVVLEDVSSANETAALSPEMTFHEEANAPAAGFPSSYTPSDNGMSVRRFVRKGTGVSIAGAKLRDASISFAKARICAAVSRVE